MNRLKIASKLLMVCMLSGAATGARAAGTYTLTCESERGAALNIALTGFNLKVTSTAEAGGGSALSGRRSNKLELSIRFAPGHDYQTMLSMAENGELLRSCKLVDGAVSGVAAGNETVTQMGATNGKVNKGKNNPPATSSTGGAMEWILTNATVTSVTAIGNENSTGMNEGSMIQATFEVQNFSFAM